jgi:nucleoside-diphosphate-sugar epimerase
VTASRYLVVGGAGFIGSHLVHRLAADGAPVRVVDDFSTGFRANLTGVESRVEIVEGDIRNRSVVQAAMKGITHVLHQAALPSVARSVADPQTSNEVNVTGTLNLLVAARDARVQRFIYASSSSVYGDTEELPKHEKMPPRPLSPYAVSKLAAEHYCHVFFKLYGLETICLRYFNVFGPRQDPASPYSAAIPKFIQAVLAGERPRVKGDGNQTRDFTHVSNVVHANLLACKAKGAAGRSFNVGGGRRIGLLDLLAVLGRLTGGAVEPLFEEPRPGDVRDSQADISLARDLLGYTPVVDFEEGLARTLAHFRTGLGVARTA